MHQHFKHHIPTHSNTTFPHARYPLLAQHEGDWYPAGLSAADPRGLYGYQTFLALAMLIADGLYHMTSIIITSVKHVRAGRAERRRIDQAADRGELVRVCSEVVWRSWGCSPPFFNLFFTLPFHYSCLHTLSMSNAVHLKFCPVQAQPPSQVHHHHNQQDVPMAATPSSEPAVLADFPEAPEERAQRELVFKRDRLPWWVGPAGYLVFTVAGCIALPLLYPPIKVKAVAVLCVVRTHVGIDWLG